EAGKPRWDWVAPEPNTDLINKVKALAEARLGDAYRITEKQARYEQIDAIKADVIAQLTAEDETISSGKIVDIITALESQIVRSRIIAGEPRIDGRTVDTVRALDICTGVLPRTHGSA
ncbi:polyribonucleotide nucleotidyltransferase, partial [Glaesserella parasuis]|nr:polyribonucleotide nucleotidyltransferase [Glaesserella parasuis]